MMKSSEASSTVTNWDTAMPPQIEERSFSKLDTLFSSATRLVELEEAHEVGHKEQTERLWPAVHQREGVCDVTLSLMTT